MGRLVHTDLGLSSLVAHVLHYHPPTHANSFVIGPEVIETHSALGIACLPVQPCSSDSGYADLPLTLLGAPVNIGTDPGHGL
jgi:hypothetical protein